MSNDLTLSPPTPAAVAAAVVGDDVGDKNQRSSKTARRTGTSRASRPAGDNAARQYAIDRRRATSDASRRDTSVFVALNRDDTALTDRPTSSTCLL